MKRIIITFNNSFKKKPTGDEQIAIDVEKQNNKGKLTFGKNNTGVNEARIQTFNAGVDIADSIKRGIETNKAQNEMYENFSSNNLYASDPSRDRGDYDTNSGLYRPNEQGQMWNSRSKQFGGYTVITTSKVGLYVINSRVCTPICM